MENVINVSSDTREAVKPTIVPESLLQNYNFQLENEKHNTKKKQKCTRQDPRFIYWVPLKKN